jgi:hypothetical protein
MSPKAGFKHIPLTAHKKGLMPLAEFTKVVGVPGSEVDEDEPPPHANKVTVAISAMPVSARCLFVSLIVIFLPAIQINYSYF